MAQEVFEDRLLVVRQRADAVVFDAQALVEVGHLQKKWVRSR